MKHEEFLLKVKGGEEPAKLVTYLWDSSEELKMKERALVLIFPGGGYGFTSDREAESMAIRFMAMGYHTAVLRYSCAPSHYPVQLLQAAEAIRLIRSHAKEWHVKSDKVVLLGCSAGGHLAAHLAVSARQQWLQADAGATKEELRPDGLILCYPVITTGEYRHDGSFRNLLGEQYDRMLSRVSLEKLVNSDVPKTFLWHTWEDAQVPVENTMLFLEALRKNGVEAECHIYPKGIHGLSLANELTENAEGRGVQQECTSWLSLIETWLSSL